MDHRTTSQEASPNGHPKAEIAAPAHTPTPWQVIEHDNGLVVRTTDSAERPIASMWLNGESPRANAAFIVKATSNHYALVNALQNARNYIDGVIINTPDKKKRRNFGECLRIIDDALAGVKP